MYVVKKKIYSMILDEHLRNFDIRAGMTTKLEHNSLCYHYEGIMPSSNTSLFPCQQHVRSLVVSLNQSVPFLQLAEVQVFGTETRGKWIYYLHKRKLNQSTKGSLEFWFKHTGIPLSQHYTIDVQTTKSLGHL